MTFLASLPTPFTLVVCLCMGAMLMVGVLETEALVAEHVEMKP